MDVGDLDPDPHAQFDRWFADATDAGSRFPEQMALATAGADGGAFRRMVLSRATTSAASCSTRIARSRKAEELGANPRAAAVLYWEQLNRQVRIEGAVEPVSDEESFAYFRSRPRSSRIGAWASPQSRPVASRDELERRVAEIERRFADEGEIPLPPFWGGYRIVATAIEFWHGQPDRLHDRLRYEQTEGSWRRERLGP